ncbi:MAG: hypothetical protein RSB39_08720 [Oscillospiraceae bacterium]
MSLSAALLSSAKNYLDMTWTDAAGDEKLSGILSRGMKYLDGVAGAKLDYDTETNARALLLDYARYVRANALQDFVNDFLTELNGLHIDSEVKAYVPVPSPK